MNGGCPSGTRPMTFAASELAPAAPSLPPCATAPPNDGDVRRKSAIEFDLCLAAALADGADWPVAALRRDAARSSQGPLYRTLRRDRGRPRHRQPQHRRRLPQGNARLPLHPLQRQPARQAHAAAGADRMSPSRGFEWLYGPSCNPRHLDGGRRARGAGRGPGAVFQTAACSSPAASWRTTAVRNPGETFNLFSWANSGGRGDG